MATNKTLLFEKVLNPNAYWSTGVTFLRANPVPIEKYSVFKTLADAKDYAETNPVAYPGQIVSVIEGEQEYSEWTFNSGTHTCVWNTNAWYIDTYKCETPGQTIDDTTVIANNITATRRITKPYNIKSYLIVSTLGGLLQLVDENTVRELSNQVELVQSIIKGGVNYKGHINLDKQTTDTPPRPLYPREPESLALSAVFGRYYGIVTIEGEYIENRELSNGYMYNITTSSPYTTIDGITFENNDYIIIHNHDADCIDISALTRDLIDIIESLQDDYVRLAQLNGVSAALSIDYTEQVAGAKAYTDNSLRTFSGEVEGALNGLLATLSNDYVEKIGNLSDSLSNVVKLSVEDLQTQVITRVADLSDALSNDVKLSVENLDELIATNNTDIANIQSYISGDNSLCTELSNVKYHYNKTFVEDEYTTGSDTKVDVLKVVNSQNTSDAFKLIYLSGTLVLETIDATT